MVNTDNVQQVTDKCNTNFIWIVLHQEINMSEKGKTSYEYFKNFILFYAKLICYVELERNCL